MLGPFTILFLFADSQKHAVNPVEMATRAHVSIATTKCSTFYMSSPKPEWIINSDATDHTTFDHSQLISRKPSTQSVVSNANSTLSPVAGEDIFTGKTIDCSARRANSTTWTGHWIVRPRLIKLSQQVELVLRGRKTKFGYGINVLGMSRSVI
ncbi:unnamed protein product [Prunus armeniaca]